MEILKAAHSLESQSWNPQAQSTQLNSGHHQIENQVPRETDTIKPDSGVAVSADALTDWAHGILILIRECSWGTDEVYLNKAGPHEQALLTEGAWLLRMDTEGPNCNEAWAPLC